MSQQDNFSSGFVAGAVVGGVIGGFVGAWLASRKFDELEGPEEARRTPDLPETKPLNKGRKRPLKASTEQNMEIARRSLEDKIAQLNDAIDDVRQQLGGVNGTPETGGERSFVQGS